MLGRGGTCNSELIVTLRLCGVVIFLLSSKRSRDNREQMLVFFPLLVYADVFLVLYLLRFWSLEGYIGCYLG